MRVLHVIDALGVGGGAEHSLASLLPRLRDRGVSSSVAVLLPRVGGLQAQVVEEGFAVDVLPGPGRPGQVRSLRRRIRAERPDLVHATLVNASLVARAATLGTGVPLVNSFVNTTYDPVRVELMGLSRRKLAVVRAVDGLTARHRVDRAHVLTEAVRDEVVHALGVDAARTTVVPRGRDGAQLGIRTPERRARTRRALGIGPEVPVVLNVGRQDAQKGQVALVEAVAALGDEHRDVVLLIAGRPGSATAHLEAAIATSGLGDRVRLLGHRTDVPDLLGAADVFAFPSWYEGLGCVLIEAMALEVPTIGSDAAAVVEVLEGGALGEVVTRGDGPALTAALHRLLTDPDRGRELARRARTRFLERYDLDRVADATVALYAEVLEGRRP